MVEKSHSGKCHGDIVFVTAFDHKIVPDGTARLNNVRSAAPVGTLDIIAEGEESVGADRYSADLR